MLVDLHAHTKGISFCCRKYAHEVISLAKENGFDGLAIANHYARYYFSEDEHEAWIEKYIAEWNNCIELGEAAGIKIFRAIEVSMDYDERVHMLIYGADESFIRENLFLNTLALNELYALCKKNGCALVQAHPFRGGTSVNDTRYLDGLEINCHPLYKTSRANDVITAAKQSHLALTCGCDYHGDTYRPKGGTILPSYIANESELAKYILESRELALQVHEPEDNSIYKLEYQR